MPFIAGRVGVWGSSAGAAFPGCPGLVFSGLPAGRVWLLAGAGLAAGWRTVVPEAGRVWLFAGAGFAAGWRTVVPEAGRVWLLAGAGLAAG